MEGREDGEEERKGVRENEPPGGGGEMSATRKGNAELPRLHPRHNHPASRASNHPPFLDHFPSLSARFPPTT